MDKIETLTNKIVDKLKRKRYFKGSDTKRSGLNHDIFFNLYDKNNVRLCRHILKKLKVRYDGVNVFVMVIDLANNIIGQYKMSNEEEENIFVDYISSFIHEHARACIKTGTV